ncbi:predicted protein [Plenodomus lingam JN3]|uniref:Uncharacterized protein n=1 Tax=Leptosphaeria maculans (strain JN3 / isolate v23.1.3 / race Av1-4-5-6-7-8) TaxID=985895 RepID=E5A7S4_LEPMJ|nr:predicted protein [Plenodomus lingam JN3]CBX99669.1 predicted protein [Plenodomus lingam JN3]
MRIRGSGQRGHRANTCAWTSGIGYCCIVREYQRTGLASWLSRLSQFLGLATLQGWPPPAPLANSYLP